VAVSFADVLKGTGSAGQRKGLEAYDGHIVTLDNFKIDLKGRKVDKDGNDKAQRRVLTAQVNTEGIKPRRARIPVRYAQRFMEAIELRANDNEPFIVSDVLVKVGEHGATLVAPEQPKPANVNGTGRRGRPRKTATEPAQEPATV
jgi:hypothetical protein